MMTGSASRIFPRATAALAALILTVGLAACAPEPDAMPSGKQPEGAPTEPSWPESGDAQDTAKQTTLPDSFPSDRLPLGEAVVDDAGERAEGAWFVVLQADSLDAASLLLDQIALDGAFELLDDAETGDGGRSASLSGQGLQIGALTLMDGEQALLSLDVSETQI